jgi:hypothetical protein
MRRARTATRGFETSRSFSSSEGDGDTRICKKKVINSSGTKAAHIEKALTRFRIFFPLAKPLRESRKEIRPTVRRYNESFDFSPLEDGSETKITHHHATLELHKSVEKHKSSASHGSDSFSLLLLPLRESRKEIRPAVRRAIAVLSPLEDGLKKANQAPSCNSIKSRVKKTRHLFSDGKTNRKGPCQKK